MKRKVFACLLAVLLIISMAVPVLAAQTGYVQLHDSYSESDGDEEGFDVGKSLLISAAIALVIALIVTGIMRGQLKSVRKQYAANQYTKPGSMDVTNATDLFLYRNVTRIRREQNDSGKR